MSAARDAIGPMAAPAAPPPGIARLGEADVAHQFGERILAEPDRCCELTVDGVDSARRPDLAGMTGEAVGKVDPDPAVAEAAIGERGAARIGFGGERRSARRRQ